MQLFYSALSKSKGLFQPISPFVEFLLCMLSLHRVKMIGEIEEHASIEGNALFFVSRLKCLKP